MISRIASIHRSKDASYFFNSDSIPEVVLKQMIDGTLDGADGRMRIENFIADRGEYYELGCDVSSKNTPTRKFLFGQRFNRELLFFYLHGGFGTHMHVVHVSIFELLSISSFVTLRNCSTVEDLKLDYRPPLDSIWLDMPLVEPDGLRVLHNVPYERGDLF
ncbi:MAG: hypothetical protein IPP33_06600 [Flavobacteriales bacterium]|nr:hypothetical protein [Flavobacteriales bacterium]